MDGIIASQGKALAKSFPVQAPSFEIEKTPIHDIRAELDRFEDAKAECAQQLGILIDELDDESDSATIAILEFQQLMLEDTDFLDKITDMIEQEKLNCEYAVQTASDEFVSFLQNLTDNDYLRERATDVSDLSTRLLSVLLNVSTKIEEPDHPYIAIAEDIAPSRLAELDHHELRGIVLEEGSITSHCAIIATSLGIPCLVQVTGILEADTVGKLLLVDAIEGEVTIDPDDDQISAFKIYEKQREEERELFDQYAQRESRTLDGAFMGVYANIISKDEVEPLLKQGGEGVGLFRTELVYMLKTNAAPTEEEQYAEYFAVASALEQRPLIIRTLDVGGDKEIEYLHIQKEENPYLGYRAIRYCLDNPDLFKAQIAAILRAGADHNVKMMLPLITCKDEITKTKQLVKEVCIELDERGVTYDADMQIGIMMETPAAALDSARLARDVDFFSIGTNDLSQYLFAADRNNAKLLELNSFFQPTLLRAIDMIARTAHEAGIEVEICGRAGEILELVPLWIAMGIDNVSVSIPAITKVRHAICHTNKADSEKLKDAVLELDTVEEVRVMLSQYREQGGVRP
ncbi:MAG: phosphoenolpyruvate--protein phosphotransferase [Coriobacteriia bacterium]|nr:phosphoenolpyruvate--protein phosphotransferase [Coriobacteriia bacterium]